MLLCPAALGPTFFAKRFARSRYVPELLKLASVEHLVPGVADAFDQSIVQIGPQDEVVES